MLIKRFLRCQENSSGKGALGRWSGSVAERWEKLPQKNAGQEQEGQGNAEEQNHLEKSLPAAERVGRNQVAHRLLPRRLLDGSLAALTS